jgi:hypothetical protein
MTISPLPIGIIVLVAAMMSSAHAQTGKDLFVACTSKILSSKCRAPSTSLICAWLAGRRGSGVAKFASQKPNGNEASIIFTETLADIKTAAAQGRGLGPEANPFFTSPQNAALAATLGMKFRCPQKGDAK